MDALPEDVRQELVMSAAVLDGHAVTTHRFRSERSADRIVESIRARLRGAGVPFVESRSGDWSIVSTRGPDGIRTVQLRSTASGTEGLSSWWRRPAGAPAAARAERSAVDDRAAGWLPPQARVIRRVDHGDPGREAGTLVALVPSAPEAAAHALRHRLRAAGFGDDPALGLPASRAAWYVANGEAVAFRRGREELVGTVSPHPDGAAIVLHWGAPR